VNEEQIARNFGALKNVIAPAVVWQEKWEDSPSRAETDQMYRELLRDLNATESPEFIRGMVCGLALAAGGLSSHEEIISIQAGIGALNVYIKDYDPFLH
jgi:hypothetical protein